MSFKTWKENGVDFVVSENKEDEVAEGFCVGDLFFVVFENGKYVIENMAGGKCLVVDGSELELVKI